MKRATREALVLLAVYLALFAAWSIAGGRFIIAYDLWQFLPWPELLYRLGPALLDLHAQPPLLNLVLGLDLKLAVATGTTPESWLLASHFLLGAATVLATWRVAVRLVPRPWLRRALLLVYLGNPYLYASLHFFFYTVWDPFFLAMLAWIALAHFERPSPGRLVGVLSLALPLVHARSLYHPIWLALVALALLLHARSAAPGLFRRAAVAGLAALALASAWPVKNLVRFGVGAFSSWQGYNLSRGLVADVPLAMRAFLRRHAEPPEPQAAAAAASDVPPRFRDRPALSALAKPDGSPNWNHYAVIVASREMGQAAWRLIRQSPWLLALRAIDYYLDGYAIYEGRDVYTEGYVKELEPTPRWARTYEIATMWPLRSYDPRATRLTTGFALLFPVIVAVAAILLWRPRRAWDGADWTAAFLLGTILWVLAMVLGVDGAEGNRMRFDTHAYLLLVLGWTLCRAWPRTPGPASAREVAGGEQKTG